ncbi:MAG: bifunctional folylpolyglutamate synthase/dihydrofolate synthase [Muribaculaceae bacterium]|nr:bifunctional folylpolyglutamate synthase/dihydrofolate synthase [Muribaculaceae bacterium]
MNYNEAISFLYNQTPQFEKIGAAAYKPGLDTTRRLDDAFGNPHTKYKTIHIAGTNGKGSTAHTLAAILQSAGYRTGLYTSPHLVSFRERMRVNGIMITEDEVVDFLDRYNSLRFDGKPSFFELTTIMAFDFFARHNVEVAVIETGLGGRLDSTNIITPALSIITNISKDHTAQLGETLPEIASEKAGIIKPGVPVVLGGIADNLKYVFEAKAKECGSPIYFSDIIRNKLQYRLIDKEVKPLLEYKNTPFGTLRSDLTGDYQPENMATVMTAATVLNGSGIEIADEAVSTGMEHTCELTGLTGRWSIIPGKPSIVIDTGHNLGGWQVLSHQISGIKDIIIGFVKDKDVTSILSLLPRDHRYYFTAPSIPRGLPAAELAAMAAKAGLTGEIHENVGDAIEAASRAAGNEPHIFLGGSNYLVGEALDYLQSADRKQVK